MLHDVGHNHVLACFCLPFRRYTADFIYLFWLCWVIFWLKIDCRINESKMGSILIRCVLSFRHEWNVCCYCNRNHSSFRLFLPLFSSYRIFVLICTLNLCVWYLYAVIVLIKRRSVKNWFDVRVFVTAINVDFWLV